ncbi:hypothetical protein KC852_01695 [Candidatus Nomurabacteria bacterium]|nr:hypothetical protein [Candidatus Nomurabacteria bacterium]
MKENNKIASLRKLILKGNLQKVSEIAAQKVLRSYEQAMFSFDVCKILHSIRQASGMLRIEQI